MKDLWTEKREVTIIAARFEKVASGISDYSYELASSLERYSRYKVTRLAPNRYIKSLPLIKKKGVYNLINYWLFYGFGSGGRSIKDKNVHAVSVGDLPPHFFDRPKKKIVTVQDTVFVLNPKNLLKLSHDVFLHTVGRHFLESYARLGEYDHIIASSELIKTVLVEFLVINPEKISVIPLIIDTDKFKKLKNVHPDRKKTTIGYINTFGGNKSEKLKTFIEAFKKTKDIDLELRIYGPGFPFASLIKDDSRIKSFGPIYDDAEMNKIYNTFDVYLQTSTIEPFGIPPMKAKAAQVPVLCYDGRLPEIVKRNTILWHDYDIARILQERRWDKINIKKAHKDSLLCNPKNVAHEIENLYNKVFY